MRNPGNSVKFQMEVSDRSNLWSVVSVLAHQNRMKDEISTITTWAINEVANKAMVPHAAMKAKASPDGNLSHMFDYGPRSIQGAAGIDPKKPLWRTHVIDDSKSLGGGINKRIAFSFVDSKRPVPKITMLHDKVPLTSKSGNALDPQPIFKKKAVVIESGKSVTITPKKDHQMLFIPVARLSGKPPLSAKPEDNFILHRGPLTMVPGKKNQGQFTRFFFEFWNKEGQRLVNGLVDKAFHEVYGPQLAALAHSKGTQYVPVDTFIANTEKNAIEMDKFILRKYREQIMRQQRYVREAY